LTVGFGFGLRRRWSARSRGGVRTGEVGEFALPFVVGMDLGVGAFLGGGESG
jgi:hypothetical protein